MGICKREQGPVFVSQERRIGGIGTTFLPSADIIAGQCNCQILRILQWEGKVDHLHEGNILKQQEKLVQLTFILFR